MQLDLTGLDILLINPGIHVSTLEVFANTFPTGRSWNLEQLVARDRITNWQGSIVNTMEPCVFGNYPEIALIKTALLEHGAIYAAMSRTRKYGLRFVQFPSGEIGLAYWTIAVGVFALIRSKHRSMLTG